MNTINRLKIFVYFIKSEYFYSPRGVNCCSNSHTEVDKNEVGLSCLPEGLIQLIGISTEY